MFQLDHSNPNDISNKLLMRFQGLNALPLPPYIDYFEYIVQPDENLCWQFQHFFLNPLTVSLSYISSRKFILFLEYYIPIPLPCLKTVEY